MNDPEHSETYLALTQNAPRLLLKGDTPRLIDEWQDTPELWDVARFEVDHREKKTGQFIFTGSTVIPKEKLEKIKADALGLINAAKDSSELDALKVKYLGTDEKNRMNLSMKDVEQ